jgi:hypothetical protein
MIPLFQRLTVPAAMVLLVTGCALDQPPENAGELGSRFTSTIPGTWTSAVSQGDLSIQMVKVFHRDGTARGVLLAKKTGPGVSLVMPEISFESRWRVTGDMVETYEVKASVPGMFKKGEISRDRIVSVNASRIVCRGESDGRLLVFERLQSDR